MFFFFVVKIVGKLEDGTLFLKKGHEGDEPLEFKTDEGNMLSSVIAEKLCFLLDVQLKLLFAA
jgi:hypothetical protein